MKVNLKSFSLALLMAVLMYACSTVPLTGRRQLSMLPESELTAMGMTAYTDFMSQNKVSADNAQTRMVKDITGKITGAAEQYLIQNGLESRIADFRWEINLINDDTPNAWAMPGGKMVVYTGILPYTKTPEGLAVVIGHEIAHVVARHGNERMSQGLLIQTGGLALSVALAEKPAETQQLFMAAFGIGSQVGISLPFSRTHEYEADYLGLMFMAMAGYNPNAAVEFWERMSSMGGAKPPEYLSTHPSDQNRIAQIQKMMPEAMKYYKK
ncbi:MAG: M48 family metallopeptidase [Bacteroidales bacterium]|nr:M48 family metallopeptidase [Bacteroidales bacterium]